MHKFNVSFVFHFYILRLTSWIWANPSTEILEFENPSKWNSYEHWAPSPFGPVNCGFGETNSLTQLQSWPLPSERGSEPQNHSFITTTTTVQGLSGWIPGSAENDFHMGTYTGLNHQGNDMWQAPSGELSLSPITYIIMVYLSCDVV